MTRPPVTLLYICRWLLWSASWLVPAERRQEWHRNRDKEVWHWIHFLAESDRLTASTRLEVLRHCWRAFPAALWERFDRERTLRRLDSALRSPALCLGILGGALLTAVLATGFAPTVRSMVSLPYANPSTLFAVRPAGRFMWFRSDQLLRVTEAWKRSPLVKDIAAYSFQRGTLTDATGRDERILSAQVGQTSSVCSESWRTADARIGNSAGNAWFSAMPLGNRISRAIRPLLARQSSSMAAR